MLWEVSSLILFSFTLVHGVDFTGKKLKGNVLLPADVTEIKNGSSLKVSLEDARKADGESIPLAKTVINSPELKYVQGQPIAYSIDLKGELDETAEYSLSATLNVGWVPVEGGDEWVKQGDFLTDTVYNINLSFCSKPDQMICDGKDIMLVKVK